MPKSEKPNRSSLLNPSTQRSTRSSPYTSHAPSSASSSRLDSVRSEFDPRCGRSERTEDDRTGDLAELRNHRRAVAAESQKKWKKFEEERKAEFNNRPEASQTAVEKSAYGDGTVHGEETEFSDLLDLAMGAMDDELRKQLRGDSDSEADR